MSWRRLLIEHADRPGGRRVLGALATAYAKRRTGGDVGLFFDRVWLHRAGHDYVPLTHLYQYASRNDWHIRLSSMIEESNDYWFHLYRPRVGDTIVDIGAGDGSDLPAFSRSVGPGGRVVAVEAHPQTAVAAEQVRKWNGLENVTVRNVAIMDRRASVYIENRATHIRNAVGFARREGRGREIQAVSLDDLCVEEALTRIDFLKMNVEGAELYALRGGRETLRRVEHICVACHDFLAVDGAGELRTKAMVVDLLRRNGFNTVLREDDPRAYVRDHVHGVRDR